MIGLKFERTSAVEEIVCEDSEYEAWDFIEVVGQRIHRFRQLPKDLEKYHHDCPTQIVDYYFSVVGTNHDGTKILVHSMSENDLETMIEHYKLV